jgi:uncharacterized NAD(P)/FAD-binding protein YdhS
MNWRYSSSRPHHHVAGTDRCPRFAIIGVGPRGLTVFERLCANLRKTAPDTMVEVFLIDAVRVGTGSVWRTDQPTHLLMNTVASQITVFTDESVDMAGPVQVGPSVYEWARYIGAFHPLDRIPDAARAEAERLTPDTYPSRSFFGHYLRWAYEHIRQVSQDFIKVTEIAETAVDLTDDNGKQTIHLADGRRIGDLDGVVLAQGHLPAAEDRPSDDFARAARVAGLHRIEPGNAANVDLDRADPEEPVIIRGLGLTFFDYLALLTEARGGRFIDRDGRLEYHPSGREPFIYAGSRRGVPYHARGENQKGVSTRHEPVFLTLDTIEELRERAIVRGDLEFRRDVWPLIAREVELVYYTCLLQQRAAPADVRRFCAAYTATPLDDTAALLDSHGLGRAERWNWTRIIDPARGLSFADSRAFQQWLLGYLDEDVQHARQGNVRGPIKAALDVLRDLRNEVRLIVDHAGITGSSYRDDLDRWYTPLNAFLSIGPPARRIAEMAALIRAGIVTLIGPDLRIVVDGNRFTADSPRVGNSQVSARCLIEARLPEPDIRYTTDPLLNAMLARGDSRCYSMPDPDGVPYHTGGLEVSRDHRVIDRTGFTHERRFALGVPTEKVRWVTAAGPRPGVNSVALSDADEVAREMLHQVGITLAPVPCVGCPA